MGGVAAGRSRRHRRADPFALERAQDRIDDRERRGPSRYRREARRAASDPGSVRRSRSPRGGRSRLAESPRPARNPEQRTQQLQVLRILLQRRASSRRGRRMPRTEPGQRRRREPRTSKPGAPRRRSPAGLPARGSSTRQRPFGSSNDLASGDRIRAPRSPAVPRARLQEELAERQQAGDAPFGHMPTSTVDAVEPAERLSSSIRRSARAGLRRPPPLVDQRRDQPGPAVWCDAPRPSPVSPWKYSWNRIRSRQCGSFWNFSFAP
jgi:hypothetical protein